MNLSNFSDKEIQEEIERRKILEKMDEIPEHVVGDKYVKNLLELGEYIQDLFKKEIEGDFREDDVHYLYEACYEYIYGNGIFKWLNKYKALKKF